MKTTSNTMYAHPFNSNDSFLMKNMPEILEEIRKIFPDCSIKNFIGGRNGEMVIVTEAIGMDKRGYTVIDWS